MNKRIKVLIVTLLILSLLMSNVYSGTGGGGGGTGKTAPNTITFDTDGNMTFEVQGTASTSGTRYATVGFDIGMSLYGIELHQIVYDDYILQETGESLIDATGNIKLTIPWSGIESKLQVGVASLRNGTRNHTISRNHTI